MQMDDGSNHSSAVAFFILVSFILLVFIGTTMHDVALLADVYVYNTPSPTPPTAAPTTKAPTSFPTTASPTTASPTTSRPTASPTTRAPTTKAPTTTVQTFYSAFGDQMFAQIVPREQISAAEGINQDTIARVTGTGQAKWNSTTSLLQVRTAGTGTGEIRSLHTMIYRPGTGVRARYTGAWLHGCQGATEYAFVGIYTDADGLMVGCHQGSWGVMHRYGGRFEIQTITFSTTPGSNGNLVITLAGEAAGINVAVLTTDTIQQVASKVGKQLTTSAVYWHAQAVGAVVVLTSRSVGDKAAATVGGVTITAAVATVTDGRSATTDFASVAQFNSGEDLSWIDVTKENIFQTTNAYLGAATMTFYVFNPDEERWQKMHAFKWANMMLQPVFENPSFRLGLQASGVADIDVQTASMMIGTDGNTQTRDAHFTYAVSASTCASGTNTHLFSIKIRHDWKSRRNFGEVNFINTVASPEAVNRAVNFRVYANPDLFGGSTPVWSYISETESIVLVTPTSGVTITGGTLVADFPVATGDSIVMDSMNHLQFVPGDIVSFFCAGIGGATTASFSLTWQEDT